MNAQISKETLDQAKKILANLTNAVASKSNFKITASGAVHLRYDIYVGKVAATATAKLQHSSGYNIFTDGKTVSVTASTDKTITSSDTTTDTITVTSHGYSDGQPIAFDANAGTLPGGLNENVIYYAKVIDANTLQVRVTSAQSESVVDISSAGSGSPQVCAVQKFSITYLAELDADKTHLPLAGGARLVLTTGAGTCTLLSAVTVQEE